MQNIGLFQVSLLDQHFFQNRHRMNTRTGLQTKTKLISPNNTRKQKRKLEVNVSFQCVQGRLRRRFLEDIPVKEYDALPSQIVRQSQGNNTHQRVWLMYEPCQTESGRIKVSEKCILSVQFELNLKLIFYEYFLVYLFFVIFSKFHAILFDIKIPRKSVAPIFFCVVIFLQ